MGRSNAALHLLAYVRRLARLILLAVVVTAAVLGLAVGLPWLVVFTPSWVGNGAAVVVLWSLLLVFLGTLPASFAAAVYAFVALRPCARRSDRARRAKGLRSAVLASIGLGALVATELVSATILRREQRIPNLPTVFENSSSKRSSRSSTNHATPGARSGSHSSAPGADEPGEITLAVVGESSAQGEPYQPWLSVGQIVAWQLERALPGRTIHLDLFAEGGICLEQAVLRLKDVTRRPDVFIVYSGHNEFQARFGWDRNVRHYAEEGPESRLALLEWLRSACASTKLILATLDRYLGAMPPPERATREFIDRPCCSPWEYQFLREDYQRRLDALADYAQRIGALLVLIVPPCSDGAFEPSRSVLAGSTPLGERAAFAREFGQLRAVEVADPAAAVAGYRRLIAQHPEFAEAHYRLGRLLARSGGSQEAQTQLALARDLDGLPLRCPSDFRDAVRTVASRHGAILIDGPVILSSLVADGILDDRLFHDAHHPNVTGYLALAQEILDQLHKRGCFGLQAAARAARVDLASCLEHYQIDAGKWATICNRSHVFYRRTAYTRYDPTARLEMAKRYEQAARAIAAGKPPAETGIPSLMLDPRPGKPEKVKD
jgi:hypothetical protein